MNYFPEPSSHRKNEIQGELDLSNYATKSDIKSAGGINTSKFAKKADLVSLKSYI